MFQGNAQGGGQNGIDVPAWRKNIRDDIKTNYHYNMALALRRQGDLASAVTHLDYAINAVPGFIPAYFEKAEILRASGQIAEAERVEGSVKIAVGQTYRASALLHRGRSMITIDAASGLADLATVCTLTTGPVAAAAHEAIAMYRLGGALRYRDAGDAVGYASELKAALAEKPDFPPILFHWAVFCREHQNMAEARRAILLAIDGSPPEDQAALIDEALLILRSTLDLATALELSRQRRTLKPESDSLVLHESLLLIGLGRSTEAVALLQREASRRADDPTLLCYLGTALLAADDLEPAAQVLSQAVSMAPSSWQAHTELAIAVARLGQQERALQELADAHGTGPDREWIWTGKGLVLLAAGLPDEAAKAMQRATQIPWPYCDRNALRFMAYLRPWARSFMDNVYDKAGVPKPQPNA